MLGQGQEKIWECCGMMWCHDSVMSGYERLRCSQTEMGRGLTTSSNDYYLLGTNYISVEGTIFINVSIHFCCHPLFCCQRWGSMMVYRGIECPCLHVKNFVVTINGRKIIKCTRWSELPVKFSAFDYAEQARRVAQSSDDEDA